MIDDPDVTRILAPPYPPPPAAAREVRAVRRAPSRARWWAAALAVAAFGVSAGWVAQTAAAAGGCG